MHPLVSKEQWQELEGGPRRTQIYTPKAFLRSCFRSMFGRKRHQRTNRPHRRSTAV